jgi:putative tricarboxylic transport membrane protein
VSVRDTLRRADPAGLTAAALLAVAACVIFYDAAQLSISSPYGLGPRAIPNVIAACLLLLAIGNAAMAIRRAFPEREPIDRKAVLLVLCGLAALMLLIAAGAGFIVAAATLFACTAAAFGRRAWLTDFAIGLTLGFAIYLVFVKVLTLGLPAGPLERLL